MFTFPSRESVFFFNFSLNKRQTKHKFKSLRGAAIHKPPHTVHLLKSLGSTSPFHSWAGQAVVVQLHQQELGYWTPWWWVSMKWKPPCPCPEDPSGVAVHTEGRLEKQRVSSCPCTPRTSLASPHLPTHQTPHALSQEQQGPTQGSPRSGCPPKLSRAQGTAPSAPWLHCQSRKPWQVNSTGTLMWWQASEWAHSQNQRYREGYLSRGTSDKDHICGPAWSRGWDTNLMSPLLSWDQ